MTLLLVLVATSASAQTAIERREAIRKARELEAKDPARAPALQSIEQQVQAAKSSPGDARLALTATRSVRDFLRGKPSAELRSAGLALVPTVESVLDQAVAANPNEAPLLLLEKGSLLFNAGRKEEVEPLIRGSLQARPSLAAARALLGIHDRRGERAEVFPLCQKVRSHVFGEAEILELLEACIRHSGSLSPESGLTWASAEDRALYFRSAARRN
jgi:hypothetical protein